MPEKLLSIKELAAYLDISEDKIQKLVDERVIPAYKIDGSYLRFRKEQIDAIKDEILKDPFLAAPTYKVKVDLATKAAKIESTESFSDKITDFIYFNDFYILSLILIALTVYFIVRL